VPSGSGGLEGQKGHFSRNNRKTVKKLLKSLIFNDLPFYGAFTVPLRCFYGTVKPLIFNTLQTSSKCLIFNAFAVLGGWVKGRVLSKG